MNSKKAKAARMATRKYSHADWRETAYEPVMHRPRGEPHQELRHGCGRRIYKLWKKMRART